MYSRNITKPLRYIEEDAENSFRTVQKILSEDPLTIKDNLDSLNSLILRTKTASDTYQRNSRMLINGYLDSAASHEAQQERIRRREIISECKQAIEIMNQLRTKLGAEIISNVDTKSEASVRTTSSINRRAELEMQLSQAKVKNAIQRENDDIEKKKTELQTAQEEREADIIHSKKKEEIAYKNKMSELEFRRRELKRKEEQAMLQTEAACLDRYDEHGLELEALPVDTVEGRVQRFVIDTISENRIKEQSGDEQNYFPLLTTNTNTVSQTTHEKPRNTTVKFENNVATSSILPLSRTYNKCPNTGHNVLTGASCDSLAFPAHVRDRSTSLPKADLVRRRVEDVTGGAARLPSGRFAGRDEAEYRGNPETPGQPATQSDAAATYLCPPVRFDSATNYILRHELFKKSTDPYMGEPHRFYAWKNLLLNEMKNLELSAIDKIKILIANTSGKPLRLVQDYFDAGAANPEDSLERIWEALHKQFGSNLRVAASLIGKVESIPPIRGQHQGDKIRDLVTMCRIIQCNMNACSELQEFNSATGLRKIWLKLPEWLQSKWRSTGHEYECRSGQHPPFSFFTNFLERKADELCNPNYENFTQDHISRTQGGRAVRVLKTNVERLTSNESTCPLHPSSKHSIEDCDTFNKLTYPDKRKLLFAHDLCFNCMGNHFHNNCDAAVSCDKCGGRHRTTMHSDYKPRAVNFRTPGPHRGRAPTASFAAGTSERASTGTGPGTGRRRYGSTENTNSAPSGVALCTAVCGERTISKSCSKTQLVDLSFPGKSAKVLRCYCIVDDQSSCSFVDPAVAKFFDVHPETEEYFLSTLHGGHARKEGIVISGLEVRGVGENTKITLPKVLSNDSIPDTKNEVASPSMVNFHSHISHLSRKFNEIDPCAEVLVLLGRDCPEVLPSRCYGSAAPYVYCNVLGWSLVGSVCPLRTKNVNVLKTIVTSDHEHYKREPCFAGKQRLGMLPLQTDVFAEGSDDELQGYSAEDKKFMQLMSEGIHVNTMGHLTMPLPFKIPEPSLPSNKSAVFHRTKNTLARLCKEQEKLAQCVAAMSKSISEKHVEVVPKSELEPDEGKAWWLPVFPIVHPRKLKVRLVFDSSAVYGGTSLNNQLLQGPDENNKLRGVLLRFRKGEIGYSTDIEAMFNQFHLQRADRDYLRFYWFKENNPSQELIQYRARVHIFGNRPSPAIANYGLKYTTTHPFAQSHPRAQEFIRQHFYVDDGLGSADSPQEAIKTIEAARCILQKFKIRLHKITSNSPEVLEAFPSADKVGSSRLVDFEDSPIHRTLGVVWDTSTDYFINRVDVPCKPFTRRGVLSTVNSIYDPLGSTAPVILAGRLIQRDLMSIKKNQTDQLEWDDPLPEDRRGEWEDWKSSLLLLSRLKLSRCLRPRGYGEIQSQTLHVFSDASDKAIGHVSYVRSVNDSGETFVSFLNAASKLSPKAAVSIPRLELCAALEAVLSACEVVSELQTRFDSVRMYTDSKVVIGYLQNSERRFTKYVSRRISLITKSFPSHFWSYVPTDQNPADIASRPQDAESLLSSRWLLGPEFLWDKSYDHHACNCTPAAELPEELVEQRTLVAKSSPLPSEPLSELATLSSRWSRIKSSVRRAYNTWVPLLDKVRQRRGVSLAPRGPVADSVVLVLIVASVQRVMFADIIAALAGNAGDINKQHSLYKLSPFIGDDGLIRVGGRLRNSSVPCELKFPIVLTVAHNLSSVIIRCFHSKTKHQGRHVTMGAVREAGFFIQGGNKLVRKILNNCFICRALRAPTEHQKMSDLPYDRVAECPPFTYTGMDVFGYFQVQEGKTTRRAKGTRKIWALLFTCLVSRAVHLEPLSSLDTSSFRNAFRRFVAVRGRCRRLRSDNGTNFVSARNQQDGEFSPSEFRGELESQDCEWEFNPPGASHFGGVWERKIGSIRRILNFSMRQLGERTLAYDEFVTLLQEAAAIINNTQWAKFLEVQMTPFP